MLRPFLFIALAALPFSLTQAARCSEDELQYFRETMNVANAYCTFKIPYSWGGTQDPSATERSQLCECNFSAPFEIPDCTLEKMNTVVTLAEHIGFVFTCPGKPKPVTIVAKLTFASPSPSVTSTSPTRTPAPSSAKTCGSNDQMSFALKLKSVSDSCPTDYGWFGSANPTKEELAKACKCTIDTSGIPDCKVQKGSDVVSLSEHYKWVMSQCSSTSAPSPSSPAPTSASQSPSTEAPTSAPSTEAPATAAPSTATDTPTSTAPISVTSAPLISSAPAATTSSSNTMVISGAVGIATLGALLAA